MNVQELTAILKSLPEDLIVKVATPGGSYVTLRLQFEIREGNQELGVAPSVMFESE